MNNNCDGSGPHTFGNGDVRVLPTTPGSNAILCQACFLRELEWRRKRNVDLAAANRYDLPVWNTLEIYAKGHGVS